MNDRTDLLTLWRAAAVLIGFQFTAFGWRLQREMSMARDGQTIWLPPAEYLNLTSLLCTASVFVLPIFRLATIDRVQHLFGLAIVLLAGYPFALAGHYGILFNKGREGTPGKYAHWQEITVIAVTTFLSILYLYRLRH
jgi:hypothetical protein